MTPNDQTRQIQIAVGHQRAGRLADAVTIYKRLLDTAPDHFDCVYLLGTLYAQQGNIDAAVAMFRRAVKIRPNILDVQYNLAVALGMAGSHDEAAQIYQRILKAHPGHPQARNNYATSLMNSGKAAEALRQYDELVARHPTLADAYLNRGMALQSLKRMDEALADYDKAIALNPNFPQAHVNRGNVLVLLRRSDEALASFNKAIALRPDFADAYSNAGNIHSGRRSYDEALVAYDRALSLRPDDSEARSMRLLAKMYLCDWVGFAAESQSLLSSVRSGIPVYPFSILPIATEPGELLHCATAFTKARFPGSATPLWHGAVYRYDRLRIAYVSADFREHAVSHLAAGMFEHHDRTRFEVTAISIGPDDGSDLRRRLAGSFDEFVDATAMRDDEIAARIRKAEIDILIDLNGYTQGARMGIFALRPAPIQVTYLGYAGTVGADYFDYILADRTVIPKEHFEFYSEKVVWLPDSFMVTDRSRQIAERTPARSELQLPDDGFVFCCFNQPYKIGPKTFDIWMRLLKGVDNSVLWLKEGGAGAARNLRLEAERRGIAPERLIFAPSVPLAADHLARQRRADLFLDTQPYNAHATTTDALWAGLPVLTCSGSAFAGRVAASLLHGAGLSELVTASLEDYEALALKLAREPGLLASIKAKLDHNRDSCALFDTGRFTRHIEAAYATMRQVQRNGMPPMSFAVETAPDVGDEALR
jgi:predicted O-linked N-acetylglucosamine transferase (SPINDLY family)